MRTDFSAKAILILALALVAAGAGGARAQVRPVPEPEPLRSVTEVDIFTHLMWGCLQNAEAGKLVEQEALDHCDVVAGRKSECLPTTKTSPAACYVLAPRNM